MRSKPDFKVHICAPLGQNTTNVTKPMASIDERQKRQRHGTHHLVARQPSSAKPIKRNECVAIECFLLCTEKLREKEARVHGYVRTPRSNWRE